MAARKTPKKTPSPRKHTSDLAEVRAQLKAEKEAADEAAEVAADREDADEDDNPAAVTYDPHVHGLYVHATHSAVPNEMLTALTQGDRQLKDFVVATSTATAKLQDGMYMGFATNANLSSVQLQAAYEYGNTQRDRSDRVQRELDAKTIEIANMIRASEDAQLERERLRTELRRGDQSLERLQRELDAKHNTRVAELAAVNRATAPLFAATATGIAALVTHYAGKVGVGGFGPGGIPGAPPGAVGGGLPAAPSTDGAPVPPGVPASVAAAAAEQQFVVSLEGLDEWAALVADALPSLKPQTHADLRALLCSYALAQSGAPPVPPHLTGEYLIKRIAEDLGDAKVLAIIVAARTAYVVEAETVGPQVAASPLN